MAVIVRFAASLVSRDVDEIEIDGNQIELSDDAASSPALVIYDYFTDASGVNKIAKAIFAPGVWRWAEITDDE